MMEKKNNYDKVCICDYYDPKFDKNQMIQIRRGLKLGLDVSAYMDPKFDMHQMYLIFE